jgi:hypothetical protein
MKKLMLLLVVIVQSMFLQGGNQYNHLNDLPWYSQVKCECEGLSRGWIFKSKAQRKCDFLDNEIDEIVTKFSIDIKAAKKKKDWIDQAATLAKLTRDVGTKVANPDYGNQIEEAVRGIIPRADDRSVTNECAMLVALTVNSVEKELNKELRK